MKRSHAGGGRWWLGVAGGVLCTGALMGCISGERITNPDAGASNASEAQLDPIYLPRGFLGHLDGRDEFRAAQGELLRAYKAPVEGPLPFLIKFGQLSQRRWLCPRRDLLTITISKGAGENQDHVDQPPDPEAA